MELKFEDVQKNGSAKGAGGKRTGHAEEWECKEVKVQRSGNSNWKKHKGAGVQRSKSLDELNGVGPQRGGSVKGVR